MIEIRLEGPGKNALGSDLIRSLTDRLRAAAGSPILLTGAGDAFSAGLDLKEIARLDPPALRAFLERFEQLLAVLYQHPAPVVALVNGHAIAGGCVLALCCDRRFLVNDPRIRMGLNEVALGLQFPPRTLEVMRRQVPSAHQAEVLLGAALFAPADAARVGIVDAVSADAPAHAAQELQRLAALPASAYVALKRSLRGSVPEDLCSAAAWSRGMDEMLPSWTGPELKQRLQAALAK